MSLERTRTHIHALQSHLLSRISRFRSEILMPVDTLLCTRTFNNENRRSEKAQFDQRKQKQKGTKAMNGKVKPSKQK